MNQDISNYLLLSLSPVFIIGVGILLLKIVRKNHKNDQSSDRK